ncbi:serine dehydratase beta chain-domain-containing protein [Flammula alnicola]|nr:serine dehydratase beta chain-domain-containing protein [Flammula alnicola]
MSPLFRTVSRLTLTARRSNSNFLLSGYPKARPAPSNGVAPPLLPRTIAHLALKASKEDESAETPAERQLPEHAVISTFDLFSIGVGPSSSHTVGPMRAAKIFIADLKELNLLEKIWIFSGHREGVCVLALNCIEAPQALVHFTNSHHTPQAILLGLEGSDPETIDTGTIPSRYADILQNKTLLLGGHQRITYDMDRDMLWRWDQVLKTHPNGMRFSCFDEEGDLLATNEYFSVGGGFVVNEKTKVDENLFYKGVDKTKVHGARLQQTHSLTDPIDHHVPSSVDAMQGDAAEDSNKTECNEHPPYPFDTGNSLLALTKKHNMTIAQIVHDNEKSFGYTDEDIHGKIMRIWEVMDDCIRTGVSTSERTLPGRLGLRRRAPMLYRRLMRGFYPAWLHLIALLLDAGGASDALAGDEKPPRHGRARVVTSGTAAARAPRVIGSFDHAVLPMPPRRTVIPAMDFLSCYAIAVNEVNASGGRIVTSPRMVLLFVSDDPEKSIQTFLLTASAIGMLFKRGSTISAAEADARLKLESRARWPVQVSRLAWEVSFELLLSSSIFTRRPASPETVLQAAEIGIGMTLLLHLSDGNVNQIIGSLEHNLGLTCDPIDGLVQVPCIERNSLGAVKAVTAAQLSMASDGVYSVTLDEAIEAMRLTAADMSVKYKETSLSGLATTVRIPLTVPAW